MLDDDDVVRWCGRVVLAEALELGVVPLPPLGLPFVDGGFPPLPDGAEDPWRLFVR